MRKIIFLIIVCSITLLNCVTTLTAPYEYEHTIAANLSKDKLFSIVQEWIFDGTDNYDQSISIEQKFSDKDAGRALLNYTTVIGKSPFWLLLGVYKIAISTADNSVDVVIDFIGSNAVQDQGIASRGTRDLIGASNYIKGQNYPNAIPHGYGVGPEIVPITASMIIENLETYIQERM